MTYKFEQFKTEIVDPTWVIDYTSVIVNHLTKTVTFNAVATTPDGSKFGFTFENVATNSTSWDAVKLDEILNKELEKYLMQ